MTEELKVRKDLNSPPFSRLVLASCSSEKQEAVSRVMQAWLGRIKPLVEGRPLSTLGPVPPVVARVKNRYREHLLIRGQVATRDKRLILDAFDGVAKQVPGGRSVDLRWDVDPEAFY